MLKAGAVGGAGYIGVELPRLLSQHPDQVLFEERFAKEPFVDLLSPKPHPEAARPELPIPVGSPYAGHRMKVFWSCSVINNLVRGATGQTVQNMTMLGFDECLGLSQVRVLP